MNRTCEDESVAADFVRPAELADAAAIAEIQVQTWTTTPGVPTDDEVVPDISETARAWERAIMVPPTSRHQVWVATADDIVVGAAAIAPAADPDLDAQRVSELLLFVVDASHRRKGHGSRLLTATMQSISPDADEAVTWLLTSDDPTRAYLEASGWVADGAFRSLGAAQSAEWAQDSAHDDLLIRQIRLATRVGS